MINWILSLILYLGTISWGFRLDSIRTHNLIARRIYIIWLFIFLCFGYMVGTDWRNYEPWYHNIDFEIYRMITEPLSGILFWFFSKHSVDFWLFIGLAKCCYLGSSLFLLSKITDKWMTCAALMVVSQYAFLLICNPLRFMLAMIPINFCLYYLYLYLQKVRVKLFYPKIFCLLLAAVLFHNSCIMYIPIVLCCLCLNKLSSLNNLTLLVVYLLVMIMTSSVDLINTIKNSILGFFSIAIDIKEYAQFEASSNEALLSIGNILRVLFFVLILLTRDKVVSRFSNGKIVFGFAIIYCLIVRFSILIPTGFRIPMPFVAFYTVYIIYMGKVAFSYCLIIILYSILSFTLKLWNAFEYIPYSNSIYYIINGHIDFNKRYWNNFYENHDRTGDWDDRYYLY